MFVLPHPRHMELTGGKLAAKGFTVKAEDSVLRFAGKLCCGGETVIEFVKDDSFTGEHYTLTVSPSGIVIVYGNDEAAFRGFTTLRQILAQSEDGVECLFIDDEPDIKNRGYMLETSGGKIPNLEWIKTRVDLLADLKYNQLQLYTDDFCREYKNFPEYCKDTQPLTMAELRELDAYCKERFMDLVPCVNGFGHMHAFVAKKELRHLAITDQNGNPSFTINPLLPESFELVDKIYDGYLDQFDNGLANIGMDESFHLGLNETKEVCDKYGVGTVYTDYLLKVCNLVREKYHRTPMFWADIVFKHEDQMSRLPKDDVILLDWGYENEQSFERHGRTLHDKGLRFYVCPGDAGWASLTGRSENMLLNVATAASCGKRYGAEGFLMTNWVYADNTPTMTALPLVFAGAMSWHSCDCGNEPEYPERTQCLRDCKAYLDRFVFHSTGENSPADLAYRMAQYYLLEESLRWNETQTAYFLYHAVQPDREQLKGLRRVRNYMQGLLEELDEIKADENVVEDLLVGCQTVILACDIWLQGGEACRERVMEFFKLFEKNWDRYNHPIGKEIREGTFLRSMEASK